MIGIYSMAFIEDEIDTPVVPQSAVPQGDAARSDAAQGDAVRSDDAGTAPAAAEQVPMLPYDFDSELYLRINTDVAEAGIEAAVHYVYQGIREGRAYRYPTPEEIAAAEEREAEAART